MEASLPPWFPAWGIEFHEVVEDPRVQAAILLEARPDDRWLLIGYPVGVSERWLWGVWLALKERVEAGTMVSRALDGEYIRLIAGTHQMKVAFDRAGIRSGDRRAWLLRIPEWNSTTEDGLTDLPEDDYLRYSEQAAEMMAWLEASLLTERPAPDPRLQERMEIDLTAGKKKSQTSEIIMLTRLSTIDTLP